MGLERYPAASLGASGTLTPDIVITSDVFGGATGGPPGSVAFDANGNACLTIAVSNSIVELEAAKLTATATVTPKVTVTNAPAAPNTLAFDKNGNLWVGTTDNIVEYAVARLVANITTAADITIAAQTPAAAQLTNIYGLAFSKNGDLWVNYDGTIAKLTTTDLGASNPTLTPAIQVKVDVTAVTAGIALDESGGLWIAYALGKVAKYSAAQLAASGSPAPSVVITSASLGSATEPVLYPAPAGLPLYSSIK